MPSFLRRHRTEPDDALVRRFRTGDEAAFAEIVSRYETALTRYARQMLRRRSADTAGDVVQDVLLRAYRSLGADDRPMLLRPWLYRIAHNRCLDELRVVQPAELGEELDVAPALSTAEQAEGNERMRLLLADIESLPERQRSALVIREMGGLSYDEIAEALDVTVPAVKSLLVRARVGLAEAAGARAAAERKALAPAARPALPAPA